MLDEIYQAINKDNDELIKFNVERNISEIIYCGYSIESDEFVD